MVLLYDQAGKKRMKCLGTSQTTLGTNADCHYMVLKWFIWNSKENYISVSKKQYVTRVNGLMIEGRSWIMKDMNGSLRRKEE